MIVVMGGATMADLTSLMIFTTYDVIVQAETVERGDPSEIVMVTTDEDCELQIEVMNCSAHIVHRMVFWSPVLEISTTM